MMPDTSPSQQSQTVGNITISGNSNAFSNIQAGGDVDFTQRQDQTQIANADLDAALAAIAQLKQDIADSDELNAIEKATVEIPVSMLEAELQKSEPDKNIVDQAIATLRKGLDGVVTLAEPVTQVAALVAKAWVGLI